MKSEAFASALHSFFAQGRYAYLMAVRGFKRTHDKPELKGQPAGQMAVVLVEDTVFRTFKTVTGLSPKEWVTQNNV